MQIQAAVLRAANAPLSIENLELDTPRDDEVLVKVVATGICHTDLGVMHGHIPYPPSPCVLGHEGSGIVVAVGAAVTTLAAGDAVALSFSSCGQCPRCQAGEPAYCANFVQGNFMGKRSDGSCTHHHGEEAINACFFGQSSFASHALVKARNAVKLPAGLPVELAGPLGCGLQTGAGAVLNLLKPAAGSSIVVFGIGAVGSAAVMAAKYAGCATIIAVDINDSRLELAKEIGATHAINGKAEDLAEQIRQLSGGGANYSIDATGNPKIAALSVKLLAMRGKAVLLGIYPRGVKLDIDIGDLTFGRSVCMSTEGDSDPALFIPQMAEMYQQGVFPFDKLVRFYDFADIQQAIADTESGATIKPIVRLPQ